MRTLRRLALASLSVPVLLATSALLPAGCALPSRDNLADPQNRPVAILAAVTLQGGRSTPFAFDASGSYDPQDPNATLHYAWEFDDPLVDVDLDPSELDDFDDGAPDAAQVSHSFPRVFAADSNGEGVVIRHVRVRVTNDRGGASTAETSIVVSNERPIVDPGEALFLPTHDESPVTLDALGGGADPTTIDPDGDALTFTWTQLSGPAAVLDTSIDPEFHRFVRLVPPASSTQSLTFRVDGSDGMATQSGFLRVHRARQLWITSRGPTRVHRYFPEFRSKTALEDLSSPGSTVTLAGTNVVAVTAAGNVWTAEPVNGTDTLVRRLDPQLRQTESFTIPGYRTASWGEAEGEDLCLTLVVPGDAVARLTPGTGLVAAPAPLAGAVRTHATGTGDCWAVGGTEIDMLDANGALSPVATGFVGLNRSTVDVSGNLWASDVDASTFASSAIYRVSPTGVVDDMYDYPPQSPTTDVRLVTDLAPRRSGGVFVHDSIRQLSTLSSAGVFAATDAPELRLNPGLAVRQIVSDTAQATLWLADSQSGDLVQLFDAGDTLREVARISIETLAPSAPLFLSPAQAPDGSVVATAAGTDTWLFRIPGHMNVGGRVNAPLYTTFPRQPAVDAVRGAAWLFDGATNAVRLLRFAPSGRVLALVPTFVFEIAGTGDGRVWGTQYPAGSLESNRIVLFSSTGGLLTSADDPAGSSLAAPDAHGDRACAVEQAAFSGSIFSSDTGAVRLTYATTQATLETLGALPAGGTNAFTQCWIDRGDGAAWFYLEGDACMGGSTPSSVERFAPGETTPSLTVTGLVGCRLYGDPTSGVWAEDASGIVRILSSGKTTQTLPFSGTPVPCEGGDPTCYEVWSISTSGLAVEQHDAGGNVVDSFSPDTHAQVTDFTLVP